MIHLVAVNWFYWWSVFMRPVSIGPFLQCLDGQFACLADFTCSHVLSQQLPTLCGPSYSIDCKSRNRTICNAALLTLQRSETFQQTCLCDRDDDSIGGGGSIVASPTSSLSATCRSFFTFIYRHPCLTAVAPAASGGNYAAAYSGGGGGAGLSGGGEGEQQQQLLLQGISPALISAAESPPTSLINSAVAAAQLQQTIPTTANTLRQTSLLPGGILQQRAPGGAVYPADQYGFVDKFGLYYAHTGLLPSSSFMHQNNNNENNLIECTSAERACRKNKLCDRVQESFRHHCKLHNDFCRMTNPSLCYNSYELFKTTPLWQCRCDEGSSVRCRRIFLRSNRNPCIALAFPNEIAKSPTLPPALFSNVTSPLIPLPLQRPVNIGDNNNKHYRFTTIRPTFFGSNNISVYDSTHNNRPQSQQFRPKLTTTTSSPRRRLLYDTLPPLILPTIVNGDAVSLASTQKPARKPKTTTPPFSVVNNDNDADLTASSTAYEKQILFFTSPKPFLLDYSPADAFFSSSSSSSSSPFSLPSSPLFFDNDDYGLDQITIQPYNPDSETTAAKTTIQLALDERRRHYAIQTTIGAGFPHTFALFAKFYAAEMSKKLRDVLFETPDHSTSTTTTSPLVIVVDSDDAARDNTFFVGPGFPDDFVWFSPSSFQTTTTAQPSFSSVSTTTPFSSYTYRFSMTSTTKPPISTHYILGNVSSTLSRPHSTYVTFGDVDDSSSNIDTELGKTFDQTAEKSNTAKLPTTKLPIRTAGTAAPTFPPTLRTIADSTTKSVRVQPEISGGLRVLPSEPPPNPIQLTTPVPSTVFAPRSPFEICRDALKRCRDDETPTWRYFTCSELLMSVNRACYVGDDQPVCQTLACRNATETLNQTLGEGVFRACLVDMDCSLPGGTVPKSASYVRECSKLKQTFLQGCAEEALRGDPPPSCSLTFVVSNNDNNNRQHLPRRVGRQMNGQLDRGQQHTESQQPSTPAADVARLTLGQRSRIYNRNPLSRAHRFRPIESNLCECMQANQKASCRWLPDIQQNSCVGDDAVFEPLDTAYIAFRGACACFAGDFVCTRPPNTTTLISPGFVENFNDELSSRPGTYLFLGYSITEETRLRTEINAKMSKDFLSALQSLQYPERFLSKCAFAHTVYEQTGNIVLVADNFDVQQQQNVSLIVAALNKPSDLTLRNQNDCADYFYWIAYQVENGGETYASPLLSTVKVADAVSRSLGVSESSNESSTHRLCAFWVGVLLLFSTLSHLMPLQ